MKVRLILNKHNKFVMIIEVAYALKEKQTLLSIEIQEGLTLKQAIEASGILTKYPQIDLTKNKTGIFGKITSLDTVLRAKDRVEIYRPLIADPKKLRIQRMNQEKTIRSAKKSLK